MPRIANHALIYRSKLAQASVGAQVWLEDHERPGQLGAPGRWEIVKTRPRAGGTLWERMADSAGGDFALDLDYAGVSIDVEPRSTGGYRVRFWLDNEACLSHFAASLRAVADLVEAYQA